MKVIQFQGLTLRNQEKIKTGHKNLYFQKADAAINDINAHLHLSFVNMHTLELL